MLLLPGPISTAIISAVLLFFAEIRAINYIDYTSWITNAIMVSLVLWHAWDAAKDSSKDARAISWNSIVGQVTAGCGAFIIALVT